MAYVSLMSADDDRLDDRMNVADAGVNWLINGHNGKLTLNYQSPVYEARGTTLVKTDNKGQVVLQYQVFL